MTWHVSGRLEERRDALHEAVRHDAERAIRRHLQRLQARFPRHRFALSQGMGSVSIDITPPVLGEDAWGAWDRDGRRFQRGALREMHARFLDIVEILDAVDSFFRCTNFEVGDVSPD